ncbi:MAG: glycosyltransferase [Halieaceae bacterium]|nr:glycosyltransferase [Halieaceae bacterium]
MPKVSVILTSFNHEKYIREAIESVLYQTYTDFELIIWDDASSDSSWDIINSYSDLRIKTFRNDEARRGIYGINKAITEIASGEYIAIHHSDDVWEVTKLEKQVEFLNSHPEFGAVFTNVLAIGEDGLQHQDKSNYYANIFEQPNRTRHEWLNYFFYYGNALCHPSVLIRKQCYIDCGLYRYGMAQVGDFDMWIRLCLKYEIYVLPEKLVYFRARNNEANTSGNRPEVGIRVSIEYHNILKSYLLIDSFEEMLAIFPEAKEYYRKDGFEPKFVLAMIATEKNMPNWIKLFGMELLFDLIDDSTKAKKIKSLYGFDYLALVALTAKYDVFSIYTLSECNRQLAERNLQLAERDIQLAERDIQLAERDIQLAECDIQLAECDKKLISIYESSTWYITRPFRYVKSLINAMCKARKDVV